ncbi:CvpA family protein [Tautonia sociabilis]|uniref:CvpA family protein n=1 Tax=Tautonia sociabilis TaxID=2080755 RepID=A0A432MPN2_9BACT|nr:CvpA family protein [Tautonia sociabilis]RUL89219.1 CvpA family protein [Tautonia sociabilis]
MGMDLILGAIVLVSALRGWFRGFSAQAIRLVGLVGGIYLAGPLRDLARPIAADRLTSMSPDLLDRLLWWIAAVVAFVVLTGTATSLLNASRRRASRDRAAGGFNAPSHRGDQSAGFFLGAAKGAIVVAFLVAGIQRYSPRYLEAGGWVGQQVQTSRLLALSERYQPARRLWELPPVQAIVSHVRTMGLGSGTDPENAADAPPSVAAEDAIPPAPARRPSALAVEPNLDDALEDVRRDLERLDALRRLDPR